MSFPLDLPAAPEQAALPPGMDGGAALEQPMEPQAGPGLLAGQPLMRVDYGVRIPQDRLERLSSRLVAELERGKAILSDRVDNALEWRKAADNMPDENPGPWEHSSAVRVPFTQVACDQHAIRLNQAIVDAEPPFHGVAKKPGEQDAVSEGLEVVQSYAEEAGWKEIARQLHDELPRVCPAAVRVQWREEYRWVPVHQVDREEAEIEQQFAELSDAGVEPEDALAASLPRHSDGVLRVRVDHEERKVYDGLDYGLVLFEDLVILPANARRVEDCWAIGERMTLRGMDLQDGADRGVYLKEGVRKILAMGSDSVDEDREDRLDLASIEGGELGSVEDDALYHEFNVVELCWLDDLDRKGRMRWYHVGIHPGSGTIYRLQYLPYEHGRPHYVLFPYIVRGRELVGKSIAEINAVLQEAGSACLNQAIDILDLMTGIAGTWLVTEESGIKPGRTRFQPGLMIQAENIGQNAIRQLEIPTSLPQALASNLQLLSVLKNYSDLATSTSSPSAGRETEGQKTAYEIQQVMSAGDRIAEDRSVGVALNWAKVWDLSRWLIAQYGADDKGEVHYRRAATAPKQGPEFGSIPADLLRKDMDIVPAALRQQPDPQVRAQMAGAINAELKEHPLASQDHVLLAMGLANFIKAVKPNGWQEMVDRVNEAASILQQQQEMAAAQQAMQQELAMQQGDDATEQQGVDREMAQAKELMGMEQMLQQQELAGKQGAPVKKKGGK